MNPTDLIRIARHLAVGGVGGGRGRPRQTDLCRAVSASYYALFHTLARCGADTLAGATRASRDQLAWEQTYRALEHGHAKDQCRNRAAMSRFRSEIRDFGKQFVIIQRLRHYADYSPVTAFTRVRVIQYIDETERIITQFDGTPAGDRRAFAIYALFRLRRD